MTKPIPIPPPTHRAEHVFSLIERLRLGWLLAHLPAKFVWAAYVALNSFVTIALLTLFSVADSNSFCVSLARSDGLPLFLYPAR